MHKAKDNKAYESNKANKTTAYLQLTWLIPFHWRRNYGLIMAKICRKTEPLQFFLHSLWIIR